MPRGFPGDLQGWFDAGLRLARRSTVMLSLPSASGSPTYRWCDDNRNINEFDDGTWEAYEGYIEEKSGIGDLAMSLGEAANGLEVTLTDADGTIGEIFLESPEILHGNEIVIGRLYIHLASAVEHHVRIFRGIVDDFSVDEGSATVTLTINAAADAAEVGAVRRVGAVTNAQTATAIADRQRPASMQALQTTDGVTTETFAQQPFLAVQGTGVTVTPDPDNKRNILDLSGLGASLSGDEEEVSFFQADNVPGTDPTFVFNKTYKSLHTEGGFGGTRGAINVKVDLKASGSSATYTGAISSGDDQLTLTTSSHDFKVGQGIEVAGAGAYQAFVGAISSTTNTTTLTLTTSAHDLEWFQPIRIAGAGPAGGNLDTTVVSIAGAVITVANAASTTVAAAAVTHNEPVAAPLFSTITAIAGAVLTLADNASATVAVATVYHNDRKAIQDAIDAALAVTVGPAEVYILGGEWNVAPGLRMVGQVRVSGDGEDKTVLVSRYNAPIVSMTGDTGVTFRGGSVEKLALRGLVTAGAAQIGLKMTDSVYVYRCYVGDLTIEDCGGNGLFVEYAFSSKWERITVSNCAGYPVLYKAPNMPDNEFFKVYVALLRDSAPTAFRIKAGHFHAYGCNGVNNTPANSRFASIGMKNGVDGDVLGGSGYYPASATWTGCNAESVTGYAYYHYPASKSMWAGVGGLAGHILNLAATINPGDTVVTVTTGTGGFPSAGTLRIGTSDIPYTGVTSNTFTGCTIAATHSAGAQVFNKEFIPVYYEVDSSINPPMLEAGIMPDSFLFADGDERNYKNNSAVHANDLPPLQVQGHKGPTISPGNHWPGLAWYWNTANSRREPLLRGDGSFVTFVVTGTTSILNPGVRRISLQHTAGGQIATIPWAGHYKTSEVLYIKDDSTAGAGTNAITLVGSGCTIEGDAGFVIDRDDESLILTPHLVLDAAGNVTSAEWRIAAIGVGANVPLYNRAHYSLNLGGGSPDLELSDTVGGGVRSRYQAIAGSHALLGTTSNHPLAFHTNNTARWWVDASGNYHPHVSNNYDVGTSSFRARSGYFGTSLDVGVNGNTTGQIVLRNSTNANTATIKPGVTSADWEWTLPTAQGGANTFLKNNGSGVLSWEAVTGTLSGSGTVGKIPKWTGSTTQLGDSIITESGGALSVAGGMAVSGNITSNNTHYALNTGTSPDLELSDNAGGGVRARFQVLNGSWARLGTTSNHPIEFRVNDVSRFWMDAAGQFYPDGNGTQNLGGLNNKWGGAFFAGNVAVGPLSTASAPIHVRKDVADDTSVEMGIRIERSGAASSPGVGYGIQPIEVYTRLGASQILAGGIIYKYASMTSGKESINVLINALTEGAIRPVFETQSRFTFYRYIGWPTVQNVGTAQGALTVVTKKYTGSNATLISGIGPSVLFASDTDAGAQNFIGRVSCRFLIDHGGSGVHRSFLSFAVRYDTQAAGNPPSDAGAETEVFKVDHLGNALIGGLATPGTSAAKSIQIPDGTAPTANISGVQIYSTSGECYIRDGGGTAVHQTPHRADMLPGGTLQGKVPFSYYAEQYFLGERHAIDMGLLVEVVEELAKRANLPADRQQFSYVEELPAERVLDWDVEEERLKQQRDAERADWDKKKAQYDELVAEHNKLPASARSKTEPPTDKHPGAKPEAYVKKQMPKWLKERVDKKRQKPKNKKGH